MEESALYKDQRKLLNELRKKYYAPPGVYYDIEVIKMALKRLNIDSTHLNVTPPYNSYKHDSIDKEEVNEYMRYCDSIDKNYDIFLDCSKSYMDLLKNNRFMPVESFNCSKPYSMKEMVYLLIDFYASLGKAEFEFVKKYFNEKRVFLCADLLDEEDVRGQCIATRHLNGAYIFVKYNGEICMNTIINLVHELGHAYEREKVSNKFNRYNRVDTKHMVEISSNFYQLEFLRYLEKNKINLFETRGLINYHYSWIGVWNKELLDITEQDVVVEGDNLFVSLNNDDWFINANYEFTKLFNKCDENLNTTDDIFLFSADIDENIMYGIGGYIALHFSELMKQDPKEFKKNFNKFLSMRTLMEMDAIIKMMGLNMEEFLSGKLIEPQIIKDQEAYRRQYKINI